MVVVVVAASAAFAVAVVFLVGFLLLLLLFVVLVLLLDTLCCDGVLLSTPHFTLTSQSAQRSLIADRAHEHLQGLSPELQDVNPKPSYYALKAIHGLGFRVLGFGFRVSEVQGNDLSLEAQFLLRGPEPLGEIFQREIVRALGEGCRTSWGQGFCWFLGAFGVWGARFRKEGPSYLKRLLGQGVFILQISERPL